MMNDIIKIVVKGCSGYCKGDEAYNDKITLDENSISYVYAPAIESEFNLKKKWSYRTTNPAFKKIFGEIKKTIPEILNEVEINFATDVGVTEFVITYADKTKAIKSFCLSGREFKDFFRLIKKLVPDCEDEPKVLYTFDDCNEQS